MFLTTRTETEALLLEQNLIKQLKPKFNVLLRDDKSFPNILVTAGHDYPQIKKHRGARKEQKARTTVLLRRRVPSIARSTSCSASLCCATAPDAMFESRTRPCLQFQIKRCSAPCVGKITPSGLQRNRAVMRERFLCGKNADIQAKLAREMSAASEEMEFERAAALRDRIKALTQVQTAQGHEPAAVSRGRRHRAASGRGTGLRAGLFHPRQPELGQPRSITRGWGPTWTRQRRWRRSWASSMTPVSRPVR